MMTVEDNIPRSINLKNPYYIVDPKYKKAYRKMVQKCIFPAAFSNGIFNIMIGIVVCIAGLVTISAGLDSPMRIWFATLGFVVGAIVAWLYARFMQSRALFPRGGSMDGGSGIPLVMWLVPLIVYIGVGIFGAVAGGSLSTQIVVGAIFACIEILAFSRSGSRTSMLFVSLALLVLPSAMAYFGLVYSSDPFSAVLLAIPNIGILLVISGTIYTQGAIIPSVNKHNREKLFSYLASDNHKRIFQAVAYLCTNIDPKMLPRLLVLSQSDDYLIAYTSQIAIGNMWGAKPREMFMPSQAVILEGAPAEAAEKFSEQYKNRRKAIFDRWMSHFHNVEKTLQELSLNDESDKVFETEDSSNTLSKADTLNNLFALAKGENVIYEQGRLTAIEMLGTLRIPQAYSILMELLQHKDKSVANAAITGFFGADSKAVFYIERFFNAKTSWLRRRAIRAARTMLDYLTLFERDDADVAHALLENDIDELFNIDDTSTFAATISLLPFDEPEDVEVLESYCTNDRPLIRVEALAALTKGQPETAIKWVVPALSDSSAAVRYAAIRCLEKLRIGDGLKYFQKMCSDPNQRVAYLADQDRKKLEALMRPTSSW